MGAVKNGAVLQLPRADLPFVLYTDWSSTGMGAILSQQEGGEKVVAFASRSCNPAEANYSSYEGEGVAAVWAVGHFRVYLQGRPFTLVTDHQPLLWLMQNQSLTGRNARNPPAAAPEVALAVLVADPVTPLRQEQQAGATDIWEDSETLAWLKGATSEGAQVSARARSRGQHYRWYQEQVQIRTQDGWKRVPEPKEREGVIQEVHNKLGHFGPLRTQQLLQTGWWWAGMRKEIKDWVAKCPACIQNRAAFERSKAGLQPLPIVGLGYRWSLDLAGELPLTKRERRYVVVMIEHVSKWVEVRAVSHKTAEAVADAFEEQVLTRFGACGEVLTDQGTEFQGEFEELLASCLIPHRTTSRYHPQSDGLTERLIQTLKRGLRAYGETRKRDWDRHLHWIMAGYRFSKQAALKDLSPYHLLFGREAVLPVGAPRGLTDVVTAGTAEKWAALAAVRGEYLRRLLPAALESLHVAQLRDIHRYRQRQEQRASGAPQALQQGQEVYIRRPKKDGLDVGLSHQRWTVNEVRESGVLVLESEAGVRAVDHVTNVARAGGVAAGYQGPVTRARAAQCHGRGQGVTAHQKDRAQK
ncbi:unnamed protein product [Closterium sp. NIES-64]|nr:unnamed protein product [Closterium sp. NIES-64]